MIAQLYPHDDIIIYIHHFHSNIVHKFDKNSLDGISFGVLRTHYNIEIRIAIVQLLFW